MAILLSQLVAIGKSRLEEARLQCADPTLHMKQIVCASLGWEMTTLYLKWNDPMTPDELGRVKMNLDRRLTGEPSQYVFGEEWFFECRFAVGPGVLIPRRETELLVETLLRVSSPRLKIGELGAGSGNIGISVLRHKPDWEWHAYEVNPESLPYVRRNVASLLPGSAAYRLHAKDFFEAAHEYAPYDVLVSNPPYVAEEALSGLSKEVRREPELALSGGPGGLDVLHRLVEKAPGWLAPGALFLTEIGMDQGAAVSRMLAERGLEAVEILRDAAGLDRVVVARKEGK